MTFPKRRLRAADPAHGLPSQPDDRAEHDLAVLLAEPVPEVPARPRPVAAGRTPILITVLVAAVVIAAACAALLTVRPRADVAATPEPTACATTGTEALLCGSYRSTSGTGDLAFLGRQRYTLVFTREAGLTMLLEGDCDTLHWAVRIDGDGFEPGDGGGTQADCTASAASRHGALSDAFTALDVRYAVRGDALVFRFGSSGATATFARVPQTPGRTAPADR